MSAADAMHYGELLGYATWACVGVFVASVFAIRRVGQWLSA
jgi:lipid-A-disaccharide synthase-like uncharacterized protein